MGYQSLYRKYRPKNFAEVYGQKIAKKILMNSLINEKISHAYLFFGPRGTGKTSLAKMFARICNCENIVDGGCCENCPSCLSSREKSCVDIVEIDAASNNGVDEIRELKSKINLTPNLLKYKVYIIDEVHMLSTGAFNALLKTLEEPPEHVIFILATTEYYKVPATIISRCQTIEFLNIDNISMKARLLEICGKENINVDEEAVDEIVKNSNGGLRDAIGLLDKAISFLESEQKITKDIVRSLLGNISLDEIEFFSNTILDYDLEKALDLVNQYFNQGVDLIKLLDDLILYFRGRMLETKDYEFVEKIQLLNTYQIKMKSANHKDVLLQMLIIQLCSRTNVCKEKKIVKEQPVFEEVKEKIINLPKIEPKTSINKDFIDIRINNSFVNADKRFLNEIKSMWSNLEKFTFDSTAGSIICDLIDCAPVVSSDKNLMLCSNYMAIVDKINGNLQKYEDVLNSKLNLTQKIIAVQVNEWEKIKENYLNNVKNNIKYKYIEENQTVKSESENPKIELDNREKAIELFGKID